MSMYHNGSISIMWDIFNAFSLLPLKPNCSGKRNWRQGISLLSTPRPKQPCIFTFGKWKMTMVTVDVAVWNKLALSSGNIIWNLDATLFMITLYPLCVRLGYWNRFYSSVYSVIGVYFWIVLRQSKINYLMQKEVTSLTKCNLNVK